MSTKELSRAAAKRLERDYAKEQLLTHYVKEGQTVYAIVRGRSASGMSHDISLKVINSGKLEDITYYAAHALEWRLVERNGQRAIRVQGGGMDMRFHLVSTLSAVLFHGIDRAEYALDYELA